MSPIYVPGKLVLAQTYVGVDDPDAEAYIAAVEAADEAASPGIGGLETATKVAIHSFVKGCKADGIWSAIKASCILAGARTLDGALVPLVDASGVSPTLSGTLGDWNYNRTTGLKGNGTNNYIISGRNNNADPQNSKHLAAWRSEAATVNGYIVGTGNSGNSHLYTGFGDFITRNNSPTANNVALSAATGAVFYGTSRNNTSSFNVRIGGANYSTSATSVLPANAMTGVLGPSGFSNARLAFYSIGESLNLALLDARVTDLITAIGAAIP